MGNKKLPAPRLQLRWEKNDGTHGHDGYPWVCHYELVLPLGKHDIRREVHGPRGGIKRIRELVVPIKSPSARSGSGCAPCTTVDGKTRFCDPPYRDGAHALWDSEVLGNPPIYVIAPDGMTFEHAAHQPAKEQ